MALLILFLKLRGHKAFRKPLVVDKFSNTSSRSRSNPCLSFQSQLHCGKNTKYKIAIAIA